MYDDVATLKSFGQSTFDAAGNEIVTVEETEIYVQPRGVYSSEFYNAAQLGLKPSLTLVVSNLEDYDGQKVLTFQGRDYDVIRVDWSAQRDAISLICEERVSSPIIIPEESES